MLFLNYKYTNHPSPQFHWKNGYDLPIGEIVKAPRNVVDSSTIKYIEGKIIRISHYALSKNKNKYPKSDLGEVVLLVTTKCTKKLS